MTLRPLEVAGGGADHSHRLMRAISRDRSHAIHAGTERRLSVVVPVRNERVRLPELIRRLRSIQLPDGFVLEVVVVNDASSDATGQILAALEDSTVHAVHHPDERGKEAAIQTGLGLATGEVVLVLDPDSDDHRQELESLRTGVWLRPTELPWVVASR